MPPSLHRKSIEFKKRQVRDQRTKTARQLVIENFRSHRKVSCRGLCQQTGVSEYTHVRLKRAIKNSDKPVIAQMVDTSNHRPGNRRVLAGEEE